MKMKTLLLSLFVAVGSAAVVRAADDAAGKAAAARQKMVEMHEKMSQLHKEAAECLKAGKPVKECHDALVAGCPMGKEGCPMMGEGGPMGRGGMGMRGQGGAMRGAPPETAPVAEPIEPADEKKP